MAAEVALACLLKFHLTKQAAIIMIIAGIHGSAGEG